MRFVITLLLVVLGSSLYAQRPGDTTNYRREIIYKENRFRVWNNWMSAGAGPMYHTRNPRTQLAVGANFNFHIRARYYRIGINFSGDGFGRWNNNQYHAGWIFRRVDNEKYHWASLAGISYSTGYNFVYAGHYDVINPYDQVGVYVETQFIKKLLYDVGFGAAVFADVNKRNQLIGLRAELYFSGAYRGPKTGVGKRR